jgi:hypothetical protein
MEQNRLVTAYQRQTCGKYSPFKYAYSIHRQQLLNIATKLKIWTLPQSWLARTCAISFHGERKKNCVATSAAVETKSNTLIVIAKYTVVTRPTPTPIIVELMVVKEHDLHTVLEQTRGRSVGRKVG